MEKQIRLSYDKIKNVVSDDDLQQVQQKVNEAHNLLHSHKGPGSDFLGWLDLPFQNTDEIPGFNETVSQIREEAEIFLCIGIGGSYLGARAVIEALTPAFNSFHGTKPQILYAGHNIDSEYVANLIDFIKGKNCWVNVISKSGTTTEPGITFRVIKAFMEKVYGKENARKRIIATTDARKGALRQLADEEGYQTFIIPDNVGGRFSVFTPVGLLPIAVANCQVKTLLEGAKNIAEELMNSSLYENVSNLYAAIRYLFYQKGKTIEILANFNQKLIYFAEWWKQLFGESEGKEGKGIFPASVNFTTDLHSLGQYIQDGRRDLFETFLIVERIKDHIMVPEETKNLDGLNYLAGKTFHEINYQAYYGTAMAHFSGGVPNMTIYMPELNAYWLGALIFFFEKAVAISGYMLEVNPFNQPGVEAYKTNMFKLLGKPGY